MFHDLGLVAHFSIPLDTLTAFLDHLRTSYHTVSEGSTRDCPTFDSMHL